MHRIALVADDLTGASDSGVQFTRKGLQMVVLFDVGSVSAVGASADGVAVDTDSRALPPSEAYQRVRAAARNLREAGFYHIYKKVDSTLRGNLGAEIDAAMDELPVEFAVVAPALPRLGRTTVGGRHFLHGRPVSETEIGRDPKTPVRESDIVRLLASQSRRKIGLVDLQTVRKGPDTLVEAVGALRAAGTEVLVMDAETEQDLTAIASGVVAAGRPVLWVGSAGLADFVPEALGLTGSSRPAETPPSSDRPILLVVGSVSQVTRNQVTCVQQELHAAVVEMDALALLRGEETARAERARCRGALLQALSGGWDVVFTTTGSPDQVAAARELGVQLGISATAVSDRIAEELGAVAAEVIQSQPLQGLILTGGDTAKAVCRHLHVGGLRLLSEVETGVPLSRLVGPVDLPVVTKAGAFGTAHTLVHAMQALRGGT